jgi:hypothetical protein
MSFAVIRTPGTHITGIPAPPASQLLSGVTAGPLLLWEPGNPDSAHTGVPADGSTMTDLAATQAAATIGSAPGGIGVTNQITNGTQAKIELTAKGGIHLIESQATQTGAYQLFRLGMGSARLAWVNSRPATDRWYLGAWWVTTRGFKAGYTGSHQIFGLRRNGDVDSSDLTLRLLTTGPSSTAAHAITTPPTGDARALSGSPVFVDSDPSTGKRSFVAAGSTGQPTGWTVAVDQFVSVGAHVSGEVNNFPSVVLYRCYIENLTVSGRSFATVAAIDQAEYQAQVVTPGGRYYGDTWSDPATVLP